MKMLGAFKNRQANVLVAIFNVTEKKWHNLTRLHVRTQSDDKWHTEAVSFLTADESGRIVFFLRNNHFTATVYLDNLKIVTRKRVTATRVAEAAVNLDGKLDEAA